MNTWTKLFVIALVTAVLTLTIKKQAPEFSMLVALCGCLLAAMLLFPLLNRVYGMIEDLGQKAGLQPDVLEPMWKVLEISLLTQISSCVCTDAGQNALAKLLELGGGLLAICAALPLLRAMLQCMEELL